MTKAALPPLIAEMDIAATALLQSVNGHTMDTGETGSEPRPVDVKGRVAAFEAVTAYIAVRNKLKLEGAGPSGIDKLASRVRGSGAPGRGAGGRSSASEGGNDDGEE